MRLHLPRVLVGTIAAALALTGCTSGGAPTASGPATPTTTSVRTASTTPVDQDRVDRALAALEQRYDATVGVVATDTGTGATVSYRADRRFGYASTVKVLAAAAFLRAVPAAERSAVVHWTQADVAAAGYSPVTEQHVADGLPLDEVAEAAVRMSDNTALNVLLDRIGGPAALDAALADLGDTTTEVVHDEPELNTIEPGSTEDTTTPAAFAEVLTRVLDGRTLGRADTALLTDWMSGNATGDALVRAGAPDGWVVADKSGGAGPVRNDVARVTRPDGEPIVIAVLTTRNDPDEPYDDALVAESARVALAALDR